MNESAIINAIDTSEMKKNEKAALVKQGYVLGNICSKGKDSLSVVVRKDELRKSLNTAGRNSVFDLKISPDILKTVMVKDIQIKPLHTDYHHVNFQEISLSVKVKSNVSIVFTGVDILESKKFILFKHFDSISVSGLPQDIPDSYIVDVSTLKPGDHITIGDISKTDKITPDLTPDTSIVSIGESKTYDTAEEK